MAIIIKVDCHKGDGKSGWYHTVWTAFEISESRKCA